MATTPDVEAVLAMLEVLRVQGLAIMAPELLGLKTELEALDRRYAELGAASCSSCAAGAIQRARLALALKVRDWATAPGNLPVFQHLLLSTRSARP